MSLFQFGATTEDTGRALVLAAGLMQGPSRDRPLTQPFAMSAGVCGVGLFVENRSVFPTIFMNAPHIGDAELRAFGIGDFPILRDVLGMAFPEGRDWLLKNLKVVSVAPCRPLADTGGIIISAQKKGLLGARVKWGSGEGYLTAGHVGQRVGNAVKDAAGGTVGSVVFVNDPQPNTSATADIDIALVECDPKNVAINNSLGITNMATAVSNDSVTVSTQSGPASTSIVGYCKWFTAMNSSGVVFADVYLSTHGVTINGDSGGPVTLANSPADVIGHVVAGGANTSCLQDIKPQIARVRSDPLFTSLVIY